MSEAVVVPLKVGERVIERCGGDLPRFSEFFQCFVVALSASTNRDGDTLRSAQTSLCATLAEPYCRRRHRVTEKKPAVDGRVPV